MRVRSRVRRGGANGSKHPIGAVDDRQTPPLGHTTPGDIYVTVGRDEGHPIEDGAIGRRLHGQSSEIVAIALYLVPVEVIVDGREIDTHLSLAQAHLRHEASAVTRGAKLVEKETKDGGWVLSQPERELTRRDATGKASCHEAKSTERRSGSQTKSASAAQRGIGPRRPTFS